MFPVRYFGDRYFAPHYWPKVGVTAVVTLSEVLLDGVLEPTLLRTSVLEPSLTLTGVIDRDN
jgi:hypothetical protein